MSDQQNPPQKDKKALRRILMIGGIAAVVLVGGGMYLHSGRYVHTDNAYVKAETVMIAPQVSGVVTAVPSADNAIVKKGDILFTIDQANYKLALSMAEANLVTARTGIERLKAQYRQSIGNLKIAQTDVTFAEQQFNRSKSLRGTNAVSQSNLDEATRNLRSAQENLLTIQAQQEEILAQLVGKPDIAVEDHPSFKAALAQRDQADLNLQRTVVVAPFDGITSTMPRLGDYASAGTPMLSLVSNNNMWVEANFKETDLTQMALGQPASLDVDTYPGHEWDGAVESISPASGAEFSVLPAQNATGNWVKVVQRIPVRIKVERDGNGPVLRAGMSTNVVIDTGHYPHLPRFLQNS